MFEQDLKITKELKSPGQQLMKETTVILKYSGQGTPSILQVLLQWLQEIIPTRWNITACMMSNL